MRLFLALPLSPDWRKTFEHYRDRHSDINYLRWTAIENLHVTTLFLGEVEEATLRQVIKRAGEVAQKTLTLEIEFLRVQYAPPETRARMVWAYFDPHPRYVRMVENLSKTMAEIPAGLDDFKSMLLTKGENITPHITLARFKNDRPYPRELRKLHRTEREGEMLRFRELVLFESRLRGNGPQYRVVDTFRLKE